MALTVTHKFVSPKAEQPDPTIVGPNEWNAQHVAVDSSRNAVVWDFNFPAQQPGGTLAIGGNTITMNPMPSGISAASVGQIYTGGPYKHYLLISGGVGTKEAVPITGWTAGSVTVVCQNVHSGAWTIGSATSGLQECINYAWANAYAATGSGSSYNQSNSAGSSLSLFGPVYVPPGWGNKIDFTGVECVGMMGSNAGQTLLPPNVTDLFFLDSFDFCSYVFASQTYWPTQQNGSAIYRFYPVNANGENVTGCVTSEVTFGVVVPAISTGPPGLLGYGIRITPRENISGLKFTALQINGGQYGLFIDTPSPGGYFTSNSFYGYFSGQGVTAFQFATGPVSNLVSGNVWTIVGYAGETALIDSWGTYDNYIIGCAGGPGAGIIFESGAVGNCVMASDIPTAGAEWTDHGSGNRLFKGGVCTRSNPTVGASPWVYRNTTGRALSCVVTGGTITDIDFSEDGSSWANFNVTVPNIFFTLVPGMYLRITYSAGSPVLFVYV